MCNKVSQSIDKMDVKLAEIESKIREMQRKMDIKVNKMQKMMDIEMN
jgi:hypothetical protein